jgi:hypothetical protein
MTRAYDDVFSNALFRPRPVASFRVHLMRDPSFAPHGIALEVAPAGIPHVVLDEADRSGAVVLHWTLDARSHLLPGEELHITTKSHGPDVEEEAELCKGLAGRTWRGWLPAEAAEIHDMRDEVRVLVDGRDLPKHGRWRVAWGYDLVLVAHAVETERLDPWVIIESV